tara:strand:- start:986 stop:1270 length:285 start_codon:yes stop_codon:yes gene_type:complete
MEAEAQTVELLLNAVAGPASGIVVSLMSMGAFGYFLIKYLLPQQERSLDKVLQSHEADRKTFEKSILTVSKRIDRVEENLEEVAKNVSIIRDRL